MRKIGDFIYMDCFTDHKREDDTITRNEKERPFYGSNPREFTFSKCTVFNDPHGNIGD